MSMSQMTQSDYSLFASSAFDANEYANATLSGDPYLPSSDSKTSSTGKQASKLSAPEASAKDDISLAISKLSLGIEDVSKQIKSLVTMHHEDLLSQAANVNQLSGSLTSVKSDLSDLDSLVEKLRCKISVPYHSLHISLSRLQKFQQASDILRRTSRFVILARRLEGQMAEMDGLNRINDFSDPKPSETAAQMSSSTSTSGTGILGDTGDDRDRTIAKAALSIAELVTLIDGPGTAGSGIAAGLIVEAGNKGSFNLRSINAIASRIPFIEDAKITVTNEMENMVITGLSTLNQSLLASSLQTAYNLGVLPNQVQALMVELSQDVEDRIKRAFDLTAISKDANKDGIASPNPGTSTGQQYKSRVRTEPTNITASQWTAALWIRLEKMTEEMADCCIKVYTLEKVLKLKRDTVSQTVFLDEAMTILENKPSATFWTALSRALEKHGRDSARGSSFIQQTLSTGYPKLLRLFHEFFAKIAVHTDTIYSPTNQSPETVLVLRSLTHFETLYLSRSASKLNEAIAQAFPSNGARASPSSNDGVNIARTVTNELDSARFDPLFVRAVAKTVVSGLNTMISRADYLIVKDRSAVLLSGPSPTPAQVINSSVATCLYHCHSRLVKLSEEYSDALFQVISPNIDKIHATYEHIIDPLLTAIRRELGAIIARLHRNDFGKSSDRAAGMGGPSFYMKDLVDKLSYIKMEVLSRFLVEGDNHKWVMSIVKFVLRTFVLHVSIAQPLGESGKLQLTTDMTELEFALSVFMVEGSQSQKRGGNLESLGDEYRLLRAMRPLLFLENRQLANPVYTSGVPPLIVLHHILVRSPLPLPHSLHGWQEAEYVRWVDEHSEEEARTLIEGGLAHWEKMAETEGRDPKEAEEYISLARTVLYNASP
ncbi:Golgi transport complex subunit 5-domain-containing protein [Lentinula edodes]|uniref:Golgi transport complex subunit 5-domain-containing protein n=1 Tax=Lentinula edodes TaxID=5353 RepID=UPI001E8DB655|nr:Golgi transport complex subunit 5-domain-containing protein [Lentinula edodes]KAH7875165.1 Golgi transport complex subunit 5-domain-containing protein [Lentinula edodes]